MQRKDIYQIFTVLVKRLKIIFEIVKTKKHLFPLDAE